jgi:hypothetical protein
MGVRSASFDERNGLHAGEGGHLARECVPTVAMQRLYCVTIQYSPPASAAQEDEFMELQVNPRAPKQPLGIPSPWPG